MSVSVFRAAPLNYGDLSVVQQQPRVRQESKYELADQVSP
jgi:hypothetical protein